MFVSSLSYLDNIPHSTRQLGVQTECKMKIFNRILKIFEIFPLIVNQFCNYSWFKKNFFPFENFLLSFLLDKTQGTYGTTSQITNPASWKAFFSSTRLSGSKHRPITAPPLPGSFTAEPNFLPSCTILRFPSPKQESVYMDLRSSKFLFINSKRSVQFPDSRVILQK